MVICFIISVLSQPWIALHLFCQISEHFRYKIYLPLLTFSLSLLLSLWYFNRFLVSSIFDSLRRVRSYDSYTCRLILLSMWMWSQRYKWIWLNIPCAVLLTCHWGCVSLLDHIVCLSSTYLNLSIFLWFRPGNFKNSHFIPFNLEVLQSITLIIIRLATIVSLFDTLLTDSIFLTSCIT